MINTMANAMVFVNGCFINGCFIVISYQSPAGKEW